MTLNGNALPVFLGLIAVVTFGLIVWGRPRPRRRVLQMAARGAMSVLFTLAVLSLIGALLNNEYAFYTSWSDLLGSPEPAKPAHYGATPSATALVTAKSQSRHPGDSTPFRPQPALPSPGQRLQKYTVRVPGSNVQHKVYVHLPAGYDPAAATAYPVLLALHGYPGSPDSYNKLGRFYDKVDAAVAGRAMRAPIVVVPQLNASANADSECVDVPGGAQTETWLAHDLRAWVGARFRADMRADSWATWGYSFGGWCATMLAMKHPHAFGAAVACQGYFRPVFTGAAPFAPTSREARSYDLVALAKSAPPPVALWVVTSAKDPFSYPSTREFLDAVRAPTSATAYIGSAGGHRTSVWTPKIPASFAWLGHTAAGFAPAR